MSISANGSTAALSTGSSQLKDIRQSVLMRLARKCSVLVAILEVHTDNILPPEGGTTLSAVDELSPRYSVVTQKVNCSFEALPSYGCTDRVQVFKII